MKIVPTFVLFFLLTFLAADDSFSETGRYVGRLGTSSMDWTLDRIISGGASSFRAEGRDVSRKSVIAHREAKIRAVRNLYESLGEINLDSSTTFNHIRMEDPSFSRDFSAMAQQAVVVDRVRTTGGRYLVEVFVMLDLWDEQTRLFMPGFMFERPEYAAFQTEDPLLPDDCTIYIDAADLGVSPAVIPSITNEHGEILFRASTLGTGKNDLRSNVRYIRTDSESVLFRSIPSSGQTTWIRADQASGQLRTDVRLDREGAERFLRTVSSAGDGCSINIILK